MRYKVRGIHSYDIQPHNNNRRSAYVTSCDLEQSAYRTTSITSHVRLMFVELVPGCHLPAVGPAYVIYK